jgi:two-component system, OmpR family, response regulator VicR
MKILIVEDDRDLVELLSFTLQRAGFIALHAHALPAALALLDADHPDLVLLDLNLGSWSGLELMTEIRRRGRLPVIMLTSRDREEDIVAGLDAGADDYITKPFSHRELLARVRARLRFAEPGEAPNDSSGPADNILVAGPLALNPVDHMVLLDGQPLNLTVTEFRLLHYLLTRVGAVVPTQELLKHVWGYDDPSGNDVVRVALYRLRRKLGDTAEQPRLLHTVPAVGVMLRPEGPLAPNNGGTANRGTV